MAKKKASKKPAKKKVTGKKSKGQVIIDNIASIERSLATIRQTLQAAKGAQDFGLGDACWYE